MTYSHGLIFMVYLETGCANLGSFPEQKADHESDNVSMDSMFSGLQQNISQIAVLEPNAVLVIAFFQSNIEFSQS